MKYQDGSPVEVGDEVRLGADNGVVVFSVDTDVYSEGFLKSEWEYLKRGIMIDCPALGLVHLQDGAPQLQLLKRASAAAAR